MDFYKNDIAIDTYKGLIKFTIYSEIEDLSPAIENWSVRTSKFTAKSFVNYVREKDPSIYIYTEKEFNKITKSNETNKI